MSRSGYVDDLDNGQLNVWRGAVKRAIEGHRGQDLLRDMLTALDALPNKRLIEGDLIAEDGEVCALGAVALARKYDVSQIEPDCPQDVAAAFDIAPAMAQEIAYINDEDAPWMPYHQKETPEERFVRVRKWVAAQIKGTS